MDPEWIEFWSFWADVATAFGFPALIMTVVIERWYAARAHDKEAQLELSRRYSDFLTLAMERPELGLFDTLTEVQVKLELDSEELNCQRLAAFQLLISIFEDAHFLFHNGGNRLKREAWSGWEKYMIYWKSRADFSAAWNSKVGEGFNRDFTIYMISLK